MSELTRTEKLMYITVGDYEADRYKLESLERELVTLRAENEAYKSLIGQAYVIEFTDYARVIEKYGDYESPTGIAWCVQTDSGKKLTRHLTALEAFRSIQEDK